MPRTKYASGRIQKVPTSSSRSCAGAVRSKVDASPIAIAVAGIAHGSTTSSCSSPRPAKRRRTIRYAATKQTTMFATVASSAIEMLLRTGSQSCGSVARRVKFSIVYCGGSTCVVHVPSRAKATSTIIA